MDKKEEHRLAKILCVKCARISHITGNVNVQSCGVTKVDMNDLTKPFLPFSIPFAFPLIRLSCILILFLSERITLTSSDFSCVVFTTACM